jgi:hypothetical protein
MDKKEANKIIGTIKRGMEHNYTRQQISKANKVLRRKDNNA